MNQELQHDAAVAMARCLVNIVAPCLRPEERGEAAREFYQVIRAGLEAYEQQRERDVPGPSPN